MPAQVEYLINNCQARLVFVEDEEQLDKVLLVRPNCPSIQRIVIFDMEGLQNFSDPMVECKNEADDADVGSFFGGLANSGTLYSAGPDTTGYCSDDPLESDA